MKLHAVQIEALKRANAAPTNGFGYFMQQGLGKTLTSYADFMDKVAAGSATRMLVVCPNSFKGGWAEEAIKQGIDVDPWIYDAASSMNDWWARKNFNKPPVAIINYESIRVSLKDIPGTKKKQLVEGAGFKWAKAFLEAKDSFLVFDESIQLKTHDSGQTRGAIELMKVAKFKRVLSGKPQTEGPHDLWGQLRSIGQLDGFNYFAFRNAFCKMGGFKMNQVMGVQNEDILAERIGPHVFYATKSDWTDLPPKTYTTREYTMTPEMRTMYKQMEEDFVLFLNKEFPLDIDAEKLDYVKVNIALSKYAKLAQIQCGFVIDTDDDGKVYELVTPDRNPRLLALLDMIDNELTGKLCIPYVNKYVFNILDRALSKYGKPAYIQGNMNSADIEAQKKRFNEDDSCRHILLQMKASKYGHTLLGGPELLNHCYTMAFFQNTYSLDDRSQIEDRNHRHGQIADNVLYTDFIGTPLDRETVRALQRKESVFQAVFKYFRR